MQHLSVLLFGWILLSAWPLGKLRAQLPEPTPTVTLSMEQVPLPDLLIELEKQTGMFFSYESSLMQQMPKVSFTAKDESLSYCLKRLFAPLPVIYRITGQYIILKAKPRLYTISGFVRDSASYESLISASVQERHSAKGSTANSFGFYSITLPPGTVTLRTSYVGYEAKEVTFTLRKDTLLDLPLKAINSLGEVVVEGLHPRSEVLSSRTGVLEVPSARIKSLPALLGETDVVKTLQRLPGVAMGTEGMTGLYVRGGNADENLYLLDGNPIYHTNHLLGFFSSFNPDAVKSATFYKGSFPAEYGGRLSSVIDVRTNDGDRKEYHGTFSIGLLAMRANLEGPIVKDKSSFNVSVRRTWMELFTWPILTSLSQGSDTKIKGGYHFFDINGRVNHSFSDRSRLYLSFYMGNDSYRDGKESISDKLPDTDFRWRWGNLLGSAGWNYVISNKLFASFNAGYSRYRTHIIQEKAGFEHILLPGVPPHQFSRESHYRSSMEDVSLRASFDYTPHSKHHIRMGSDYQFHNFRPEQTVVHSQKKDTSLLTQETNSIYTNSQIHGHELSLYAEDEIHVTSQLRVNAGLRYTLFYVQGEGYQSLQPRISARYLLARNLAAKVSYSKMNQYIHQLTSGYLSQPSDIWVPVTRRIDPMSAHQVSAGLHFTLNKTFDFSAEGYYKRMNNLIEYKDNRPAQPDFAGWEEQVGMGKGRSYGMELMAQKKTGKLSGWIGYTLSWSDRWFPDGTVNKGSRFPARYDNRHKIDVVATYKISRKVELTAAWMYASGNRLTLQDRTYYGGSGQANDGYMDPFDTPSGASASKRNNYQLAPYHRLDLGVNFYRYKKKGRLGIWNLSLCNAYIQPNAFSVRPTYAYSNTAHPQIRLEQTILFLFLPSLSYTYKF